MFTDKQLLALIVVGVAVGGYLAYKGKETVKEVAQAVNPTNHDNIFNSAFNRLYQSVTGSTGTLGTDLADWIHRDLTAMDH